MDCARKLLTLLLAALMAMPGGCSWPGKRTFVNSVPPGEYERVAAQIEFPVESACTKMKADESLAAAPPWTIDAQGTPQYWDVTLEEVIQLTLANSRVMRDVGGAVVRAPATTRTTYDPAVAETDPQYGIEAALSEFDAQFLTSTYWEKNDRAINNFFQGGGAFLVSQDLGVFQAAITKKAATGSRFTIRHNVDYDANNAPANLFPSAWNANVEVEARHPFLQGGGTPFNRIAGPDSEPGTYRGVLIARLNADVALNDFEIAVRDLVSNVENAYWDLYFGYRVLDARVRARDAALDTWRKVHALYESGRRGGEAEKEAQAREQYFRFQQDVQNALCGEPYDMTRNWNGLPSGAFRSTGGVLMAERRLRLLMGLPPTDSTGADCPPDGARYRLLRPIDEPALAKIDFDWCQVTEEAITRRAELRRQKWQVRRRELEMLASKNHLLPRLDGVARYRWRGFGDDLFPIGEVPVNPVTLLPDPTFDGAYSNLTSGDFQEWQLGFELSMPIGFRQAHVAARNAELLLARERAILQDQQREVIHEAADAIAELDRAYAVLQTSYNRLVASRDQLAAIQTAYESDKAPLDLFLDAQRRLTEAEIEYYLNRARYSLALKNVHFVKGTLLEYDGVYLAEGPWPGKAYRDAAQREATRGRSGPLNYASSRAPAVSAGVFPQHPLRPDANETPHSQPPAPLPSGNAPGRQEAPLPPPSDSATNPAKSPALLASFVSQEPKGLTGIRLQAGPPSDFSAPQATSATVPQRLPFPAQP